MDNNICEFCNSSFKNSYTLKTHINGSKKCLKNRGLKLDTSNICKGCNGTFLSKYNLTVHYETCKKFLEMSLGEKYKKELEEKDSIVCLLKKENDKLVNDHILEKQLIMTKNTKELKDVSDKYIEKIELLKKELHESKLEYKKQIDKLQDTIESIAKEAINRPVTTTTNNTINHIRNNLSSKYTLEDIKDEELLNIFQENLTQQIFMSGQKGIAKMCTDKIINTVDDKKLICCTDATRKKFKYMDKNGNIKEDIEARSFVGRVSKPIKDVGKQIYENMMENLTEEREHVKPDDYGKKDRLVMESFHIMDRYKDIFNIDDPKYNNDFTNELAILNKQD